MLNSFYKLVAQLYSCIENDICSVLIIVDPRKDCD